VSNADDRLDPVRRLPTGGTLLRTAIVAVLLLLAAALVYADPGSAPVAACPAPTAEPDRLPVPGGLVGVPVVLVVLADPAALSVVRTADRVDLYPAGTPGPALARDALVLATVGTDPMPVLYLALPEVEALRVTGLDPGTQFRVIVRAR
jgi:hypothetical protein